MIEVGASVVDITPPAGLPMAGFAARTMVATGTHDALTARALVVGETAIVTADVIGVDAAMSRRVRERCSLPKDSVTITATHTHGGPISMAGRLAADADTTYLHSLEDSIVTAIETAAASKRPARFFGGVGAEPGYASNRRHTGGLVDRGVPILKFQEEDGNVIAIFTSYACHPVVLGADNLTWTGDYPHFIRERLEAAYPDAIAICATGCAGDVNTGHSAQSSLSTAAKSDRSFSTASQIGLGLAESVKSADLVELDHTIGAGENFTQLEFIARETGSREHLADKWRAQAASAETGCALYTVWADWAETRMGKELEPLAARCSALRWGEALVIALPGEIFAQTALEVRQNFPANVPTFVLAYADDNPGYICPMSEYAHGGYEVDEAHRFYGLGATFAPGSAERLARAGCKAAKLAVGTCTTNQPTKINATEGRK